MEIVRTANKKNKGAEMPPLFKILKTKNYGNQF
jgi:hypothetical protein